MSTLALTKPAKKTSAPAAASKPVKNGDTIVLPPTGETHGSGIMSSQKVTIRKDAEDTEPLPKNAIPSTRQLIKTGVGVVRRATPPAKKGKMTAEESGRFTTLSKLVSGGLKKMSKLSLEVAEALREIRDLELYRNEYKTFKAYCAAELGIQKAYAYDLAKAGDVHRDLQSAMADKSALPTNERQIRPLTKLKTSKLRVQAWMKAQELAVDGKVTEANVREAVREIQPPKAQKPTTGPASVPTPDNTWHDQMVTKFTAEGFEPVSMQPINWPSDTVAMYSLATRRYVKFIKTLDFAEAACVVALGLKAIRCHVVISAAANAPQGVLFSTGEQPHIEKESFPAMFHVMAKGIDAVLEIDGTFYRPGELDDSSKTTWAPAPYLDLELPEPTEDSSAESEAGE